MVCGDDVCERKRSITSYVVVPNEEVGGLVPFVIGNFSDFLWCSATTVVIVIIQVNGWSLVFGFVSLSSSCVSRVTFGVGRAVLCGLLRRTVVVVLCFRVKLLVVLFRFMSHELWGGLVMCGARALCQFAECITP